MDISNLTRLGGNILLTVKKYSPEILVGTGTVAIVTSGVMLVRATLKVEPIVTDAAQTIEESKEVGFTESEMNKLQYQTRKDTAIQITKLYAPAVTTGVVGLVCVLGGTHILRQRNVALVGAYKALEFSYNEYRKRVQEEIGEERELAIYRDQKHEMITPEGGGKKVQTLVQGKNGYSQYAFLFADETSSMFDRRQPDFNQYKLRASVITANQMLQARGHFFLNELFDYLGMPRTAQGSIVGWIWKDGEDNQIDLGIDDPNNEAARLFCQGLEPNVWCDPNVDGLIYDRLPSQWHR